MTRTEDSQAEKLLAAASDGDENAWGELMNLHSQRVRRMVELRMDPRLQARVDTSDVIQESFMDAWRRLAEFTRDRPMPFFLWLRFLAGQRLISLHRHHFGASKRNAAREIGQRAFIPGATTVSLARQLIADNSSPSAIAAKSEEAEQLRQALDGLEPTEREILALRHFEHLSNAEVAHVLGINESTASTRYLRVLRNLKVILERFPGFLDD